MILLMSPRYAAEVAACDRAEDVNHWRYVVVRNNSHSHSALRGHQTGHERGRSVRVGACDRNILKILQSVRAILRRLRRDLIADSILWVDPKRR